MGLNGKLSVSSAVLEKIKNNILSGDWPPGCKLPGELELTQIFGVSRVSVRHALHQLVGMGVLDIRRGEGTFVSTDVPHTYFDTLLSMLIVTRNDIREVLEMRMIIETESVRLAATRATEEDLDTLQKHLDGMRGSVDDIANYSNYDLEFHHRIAVASKNSLLLKIFTLIYEVLSAAMMEAIPSMGYETGIYYHSLTLDAMKARNPEAAASYMRQQLQAMIDVMGGEEACQNQCDQ